MTTRRATAIWALFALMGGAFAAALVIRDPSWHVWQLVSGFAAGGIPFVWSGLIDDVRDWLG